MKEKNTEMFDSSNDHSIELLEPVTSVGDAFTPSAEISE